MKVTDEEVAIAQERAEFLLQSRTENEQWNALREALVESTSRQRESMLALLTLEIVRDMLYPGIDRVQWRKLGWSDALGGRVTPDAFIHKLRLAKAAGSSSGKL